MRVLHHKKDKTGKTRLKIEWQEEEIKRAEEEVLRELAQEIEIKGFRKGKAPLSLVRERVGEDLLQEKVLSKLSKEAVVELGEEPISPVTITAYRPQKREIEIEFFVLPEIKLPDYKKIASKNTVSPEPVTETEIESALEWLQRSRASFKEVQRGAKEGDFLSIAYSSPQIEGGREWEDSFILGKGHFVAGFERELVGAKAGEEREFEVEFPQDYYVRELAGKKVFFRVKIKKVEEMEIPPLTDEFASSLGNFNNLQELKDSIKEGLEQEKEEEEKKRVKERILREIIEKSEVSLPDFLVDLEKERLKVELQSVWTNRKEMDHSKLEESLKREAVFRIKKFLVIEEIAQREKLTPSTEEVEEFANELIKNLPPEKVRELPPENLYLIAQDLLTETKVLDYLLSFVKPGKEQKE